VIVLLKLVGQTGRSRPQGIGQSSSSREENVSKVVGATSSEGFLDYCSYFEPFPVKRYVPTIRVYVGGKSV